MNEPYKNKPIKINWKSYNDLEIYAKHKDMSVSEIIELILDDFFSSDEYNITMLNAGEYD